MRPLPEGLAIEPIYVKHRRNLGHMRHNVELADNLAILGRERVNAIMMHARISGRRLTRTLRFMYPDNPMLVLNHLANEKWCSGMLQNRWLVNPLVLTYAHKVACESVRKARLGERA